MKAKRFLSFLLVLVMLFSLFPTAALAEPEEEPAPQEEVTEPVNETGPEDPEPEAPLPEEVPAEETEVGEDPAPGDEEPDEPEELVWVRFLCDPAEAEITVFDPADPDELTGEPAELDPDEEDAYLYHLLPGEYLYTAVCPGYEPIEKAPFTVEAETEASLELFVTLSPAPLPEEPDEEEPEEPVPEEEAELLPEEETGVDSLLPIGEPVKVSGTVNASSLAESSDLILEGTTTLNMDVERTLRSIRGPYDLTITGSSKLIIHTTTANGINVDSLTVYTSMDIFSSDVGIKASGPVLVRNAALLKIWAGTAISSTRSIDIEADVIDIYAKNTALSIDLGSSDGLLRVSAGDLTIEAGANGIYSYVTPVTVLVSGTGSIESTYNGMNDDAGFCIKAGGDVTLGGGGMLTMIAENSCVKATGAVSSSELSLDLYSSRGSCIDAASFAMTPAALLKMRSYYSAVKAWRFIDVAAVTVDVDSQAHAFCLDNISSAQMLRLVAVNLTIEADLNGLYAQSAPITLTLSGEGTLTTYYNGTDDKYGYGISGKTVTLGGGGTLNVRSTETCINALGAVSASDLSLDLYSSRSFGIDGYTVAISNAPSLEITAVAGSAVYAWSAIDVAAGTMDIFTDKTAFIVSDTDQAGSIRVSGADLSIEARYNVITSHGADVTVNVSGTGTMTSLCDFSSTEQGYGILAGGDVTLGGGGTLTISSKQDCIYTAGSVTGSNLSLDLTSTSNDGIDAYKSVKLTNIPTLKITSQSDAIVAFDQIVVSAGTLTVDAGWNGIVDFGSKEDDSITVTAGTLSIEADGNAIQTTGGAVSLTVSGTGLLKSSYSGTDTDYGYGIKAAGNVTLGGSGTLTVSSKRDCINTGGSVTGSNLSLDLTSTSNDGIDAYKSVKLTNIPTLKITSRSDAIEAFNQIVVSAGTLTVDAGWIGLVDFGSKEDDSITVTAGTLSIEADGNAIQTTGGAVSLTVSGTGLLKSSYSGTDTDYGYGIKAAGNLTLGGGGTLTLTGKRQGARSLSGGLILANGTTYYAESTGEHDALYAYGGISLGSSLVICVPAGGSISSDGRTVVDTYGNNASYVAIGEPLTGTLLMENAGGDCRVGGQIKVICSGVPRDAAYVWQTSEDGANWTDMSESAQAMIDSQNVISVTRTAKLSESDRYFRLRGFREGMIGELFSEPIHVMRAYKVRYYPNGGSGTMDDVGVWLHVGDSYTLLESHFTPPVRKGFSAWRINGVEYQPGDVITIAGETSIYAVWERSEWQIQFSSGSGSGASGTMSPLTVPCGQSFTVPACAFAPPSGKVFSRWGVTGGKYYQPGDVITPNSDMLLVAEWRSNQTVVGFDPNGGSGSMNPVNLTPAQAAAYTVPECTYNPPEDSVFEKWQIVTPGSSETVYAQPGDTVALSGFNVTLKAVWALKPSYEVSFSANGHGTAPMPQSVIQDHYAQNPGALTAEGYTFLGWYTETAGTNRFDFAHTAITGNITLYAKWMEGVTAISIDGFRLPEAGLTSTRPQLVTTGGSYACTKIEWYWPSSYAGSGYAVSYTPICFEISTEYHAIIILETVGDALFDPNTALQSVTINGDTYGVDLTQSGFVSETKYQLVTLPITTEDLIPIDEAHFPDDIFRAILRRTTYDTNGDGYFSRTEINKLKELNLSNKGIASLAGIECLSELTTLNAIGNELTSLDLSCNFELYEVYCNLNPDLTELLLPQTAWLKFLQCYGCSLTGLDIRGCTYLKLAAEQTPTSAAGHLTYSYFTDNTKTAQLIVDENVTLYASYTAYARVCFEPGLGTGDMPSIMASKGEYYTLPANGFTAPEDMYFVGWKDTSTDTVYTAGQTMERRFRSDEHEVTFEAQWRSKKVLTITVPDATLDQSALGFPVEFTWNGTESLTSGKWLDGYDAETQTGGSIRQRLPAGSTCFGMITFPRGVSAQTILRALGAGGTMVLKNATLVDVVSSGSGTSVRVTLVVSLQPRTCTVSFMSGGGSGTMAKKTDIYPGSTYTLPNCGFTAPPDMGFGYWSLAWAGSSVHDDVLGLPSITVTVDEDLTLIARWNVRAGAIPVTPDHFPDDDFRDYVSMNFDTNHGGYLIPAEIAAVTDICMEEDHDVHSLQGIGYFTELDSIIIDSQTNLTSLDLRANTKLTHVEVWDNALTELLLDGLEDLRLLDCDGNQLTELDVSQFELTELYCYSNPLAVLQLGEQPQLKYLHCQGTNDQLRILDIRDCPYLLDAYENGTQTTQSTKVKYDGPLGDTLFVDISTEIITPDCISVDATHFPDPLFLDLVGQLFDTNHTQWLTLAEIAAARELVIEDTEIASLEGIEYLTALERLTYQDGTLETLDLTRNTKLQYLDLNGQEDLEILELGELSELRSLYLENAAYFSSLDLTGCSALEEVHCQGSCLETLTLGQQAHLRILDAFWLDALEGLDISGCPILMDLLENTSPSVENWVITFTDGENRLRMDAGAVINGYVQPGFLADPADVTAAIEDTAVFTVEVEGARLALQWQFSADGGETWEDLPGANGETFAIAVTPEMNGRLFRCAATGVYGITIYSHSATLSINGGLCGETAYWKLQDGVLTVYGAGDMYDYTVNNEKAPWYDLRTSITSVLIRDGVTSIGNYAFDPCSKIVSVSIGGDVTRIGNGAFQNCSSLTTVAVPDSVTEIGFSAYSFCSNLETVTIGSGTASMGSATMGCSFEHCYALKSITVSPANTAFCSEDGVLFKLNDGERAELICYPAAKEGESYEIPDNVTSLFRYAFYRSKYLDSVTIPASVTEINTFCFANANDLTEITFLGGAPATIKSDAFYNVTATVWYPDDGSWTEENRQDYRGHLTWIPWRGQCGDNVYWAQEDGALRLTGSGAMWNYTNDAPAPWKDSLDRITALYVEEGVTKLGNYAFAGCAALTSANLPESLTVIGECAFRNCSKLWEFSIPSTVRTIGGTAFAGCAALTELILPEGLTYINNYAFMNCTALRSVSIPSTVTRILTGAFDLCSSLTDVTIPASVTIISNDAFGKCSSLSTITFEGSAPQIYDTAFRDVTATAWYPAGDASWTEDMFQDYGGHITWMSYAVYLTVTLDPGDGTVDPATIQVLIGQPLGELPTPVLSGYGFDGWFTAAGDAVTAETVFTEDVTLVAHWHLCGDINGDGKLNNKDLTRLQRYLKGADVEVNEAALDVNGDGKVNNKDLTRLQRYLKGADVEVF